MENAERYLFRGRRKGCDWVYGGLIHRDGIPFIIQFDDHMGTALFAVDPESVGQCTGGKDKNGKLAFAGDILRIQYLGRKNGFIATQIIWKDEDVGFFVWIWLKSEKFFYRIKKRWLSTQEIIGNIHDNPELLEESEKDKPCNSPS